MPAGQFEVLFVSARHRLHDALAESGGTILSLDAAATSMGWRMLRRLTRWPFNTSWFLSNLFWKYSSFTS